MRTPPRDAYRVGPPPAAWAAHVSRVLAKLGLVNRGQAAILVHDADLG
ncbi:hypothetical protein [Nonomuraea sp. NPDC052265]